jgi:hypothetical protein
MLKTLLMRPLYILFSILCCWLATCPPAAAQQTKPSAEAEIRALLQDYYHSMSARDWTRYRTFFSEEATLTTVWQDEQDTLPRIHSTTIDEFIARTPEGPDSQPIFEEKMLEAEVSVKGGLAQAWVRYAATFGSADHLMKWTGYDLFSFIRHQGRWKIVSLVYASESG